MDRNDGLGLISDLLFHIFYVYTEVFIDIHQDDFGSDVLDDRGGIGKGQIRNNNLISWTHSASKESHMQGGCSGATGDRLFADELGEIFLELPDVLAFMGDPA